MRPKNLEKEEAIRTIAMQIIAEEGIENLSMQKLAKAANISPRTIYIKYENKEDLLIKLFIDVVLGAYEQAILEGFSTDMEFGEGVKHLWLKSFHYFKNNRHAFALYQYGKSSPMLNRAFQEKNIKQGDYFSPIHNFLERNMKEKVIPKYHQDILRAMMLGPLMVLITEYFDYIDRPKQIITDKVILTCCEAVVKGMRI